MAISQKSKSFRMVVLLLALVVLVVVSRVHTARQQASTAAKPAQQAVVLMYHHLLPREQVGDLAGNNIVTTVEEFTAQLDWLQAEGFCTVTPAQLKGFLFDGKPLPDKAVLITFDDGYLSNTEYAYPLLKERDMTATVFLVTGKLGEDGQKMNCDAVQMVDEQTVRATKDVFVFASHTHDLHHIANGGSTLTVASVETVRHDLDESLQLLSELQNADRTVFSYPYGLYTERVRQVLREAGICMAFRASAGVVTADSDPLALPRFPVDSSVSMEEFQQYFAGF